MHYVAEIKTAQCIRRWWIKPVAFCDFFPNDRLLAFPIVQRREFNYHRRPGSWLYALTLTLDIVQKKRGNVNISP
jgi:hypothetical protein